MASVILGFPNRVDNATVSGGAWVEAKPLANIKDRLLSRVARSIDLAASSTQFDVDFGRQRSIRIIAFVAHTMSFSARVRIRASNAADFSTTLYDQTQDVWGALAGSDWDINELEWENDNYWAGTYTQEETEGQTAVAAFVLPEPVQARYWRFEIDDGNNDAGYIDIGRLFIGDAFLQPRINMSYGASLGYKTATTMETSLGGAKFFDRRESIRVMRFDLNYLSEDEGFAKALELTRRAGSDREIFVVGDPDDETYGPQRNFLGHLVQPNPLEHAFYQTNSMSFEIEELR